MTTNLRNGLLALSLLSIVALGCSAVTDGKPAAEAAIVDFHKMLDDERYADIYALTDQRFKDASSEEDIVKLLTAVHTKLGKVKSSETTNWRANSYNLTSYIELEQETDFENGKATEHFTFVYADKKVSLGGYNINSMDLITK
jgi:hypothetical protein